MADPQILLSADFEGLPDGSPAPEGWWVEGGERVWIEDGHLRVKADPTTPGDDRIVCTVWNRQPVGGDLRVEFDACCVSSTILANNINFFLCYSDPSGQPLYDTRESRASAAYRLYHNLDGYIFTFLNDYQAGGGRHADGSTKARVRLRRCPGFQLLTETYEGACVAGQVYHLTIERRGGTITLAVDGKLLLTGEDPAPHREGLVGFRTFRTDLWWDNLVITALAGE